MRILGVDLPRVPAAETVEHTIVALDDSGNVSHVRRADNLPAVAATVAALVGNDEFLLGIDIPVLVPQKSTRTRPVDNVLRRRFGFRMPASGRSVLAAEPLGVAGEALMAGLATAGRPCLPYPDRDRRQSGLAETHPALILRALLWETSTISSERDRQSSEALFRVYEPPAYRASRRGARTTWAEQAVAVDLAMRAIATVDGFDLAPVRRELARADTPAAVERAAALLDAVLIAGTARRYLDSPETSMFVGDREGGYVILPADPAIRRLALSDTRQRPVELFPQESLRERLGETARLREMDLLSVPGRPQRLEATFTTPPRYEFDNRDEMLWWKHCRHLGGPTLPTEGLCELAVSLGDGTEGAVGSLRLIRSRHPTLSFRFDPPATWRDHVPTRDGQTYPFRVVRAVYQVRAETA